MIKEEMVKYGKKHPAYRRLRKRFFGMTDREWDEAPMKDRCYISGYLVFYQGAERFPFDADSFIDREDDEITQEQKLAESLRGWIDAAGEYTLNEEKSDDSDDDDSYFKSDTPGVVGG